MFNGHESVANTVVLARVGKVLPAAMGAHLVEKPWPSAYGPQENQCPKSDEIGVVGFGIVKIEQGEDHAFHDGLGPKEDVETLGPADEEFGPPGYILSQRPIQQIITSRCHGHKQERENEARHLFGAHGFMRGDENDARGHVPRQV